MTPGSRVRLPSMKKQPPLSGTRSIPPLHVPEDPSVFCLPPFPFDVQHLSTTHSPSSLVTDFPTSNHGPLRSTIHSPLYDTSGRLVFSKVRPYDRSFGLPVRTASASHKTESAHCVPKVSGTNFDRLGDCDARASHPGYICRHSHIVVDRCRRHRTKCVHEKAVPPCKACRDAGVGAEAW